MEVMVRSNVSLLDLFEMSVRTKLWITRTQLDIFEFNFATRDGHSDDIVWNEVTIC